MNTATHGKGKDSPGRQPILGLQMGFVELGAGKRVSIRRYQPLDDGAIVRLNEKVMNEYKTYRRMNRPERLDRDLKDIGSSYLNGRGDFLVAEYRGKIVGCASIRERQDKGKDVVEFLRLRVARHFRKKGLARKLIEMRYCLAKELGFESAYMDAYSFQRKSIRIHLKDGWVPGEILQPQWAREVGAKVLTFTKRLLENDGRPQ